VSLCDEGEGEAVEGRASISTSVSVLRLLSLSLVSSNAAAGAVEDKGGVSLHTHALIKGTAI
jgi:hypothetical protein